MLLRLLKTAVIAIFCIMLMPVEASAFSVSPLKYHVTLDAGAVNHVVSVKIKNEESKKNFYSLSVLGARQLDNGQIVFGNENLISENWIRPEKNLIELLPGEEENVNFFITIPATAKSGSHYIGLAVSLSGNNEQENIGITSQIISVLLLQVAGTVNESVSIKSWKLDSHIFKGKYSSELELENSGTVGVPISGYLVVRNYFGQAVFQKEISLAGTILPRSIIKSSDILKMPLGFYWPGPYNIELNINYGLTRQNILMIKPVWFIHIYYFFVGIILLGYISYSVIRRNKK